MAPFRSASHDHPDLQLIESLEVTAWPVRIVNTFANSRTAFACFPANRTGFDSAEAGMSIGMMLISVELLIMLFILLFVPGTMRAQRFIGFVGIAGRGG
jgi:K(+)-stimulated pyrophosphate-energized sodium pump